MSHVHWIVAHNLAGNRVGHDHIIGGDDSLKGQRPCGQRSYCLSAYAAVDHHQAGCESVIHIVDSALYAFGVVLRLIHIREGPVHILHAQSNSGEKMGLHGWDGDYYIGIDAFHGYLLDA